MWDRYERNILGKTQSEDFADHAKIQDIIDCMKLLVVEDDEVIADNLQVILERETYAVTITQTVEEAITLLSGGEYDLLICDRRLPDGDGVEVVKVVRSTGLAVPTLLLTAKDSQAEIIEGLDGGADDYLPKPFASKVLLARVRALLRRRKKIVIAPIIKIKEITVNTNTHEVRRGGKVISLSPKEYGVLEYLLLNQGKVVERVEILSHVWDDQVDLFSNTVDVHIRYLRQKLGGGFIETVRGKGYKLCVQN